MAGATLSPFGRLLLISASAVAVLAGMRVASPVIGPVLVSLLITIAWSPGSLWLRERGWHPIMAALTGLLIGVVAIALIVLLVWSSALQLQDKLPEYQTRVEELREMVSTLLARLPIDSKRLLSTESIGSLIACAATSS